MQIFVHHSSVSLASSGEVALTAVPLAVRSGKPPRDRYPEICSDSAQCSRNALPDKPTTSRPSAITMRPIASSGLRWPVVGVETMRILTRSSHSDFQKSAPAPASSGKQFGSGQAEKKLGDGGYTLTSDRREMVTVAMRNGFTWAQRWELETSGPFTLRAATSAMGHGRLSSPG
jgi:hypothetical protein